VELGREAVKEVVQNIFTRRDVHLNVVPFTRIDLGQAARQQRFPGRNDLHHGGMAIGKALFDRQRSGSASSSP
jgi:hypothetical protein